MAEIDRDYYVVISADCHGGGAIRDYRPYLEARHHNAFDEWTESFENPYDDIKGDTEEDPGGRNWDSSRRLSELEADGVVAEVIFPNTIPPFFPKVSLMNQPPAANAGDLELRWAGLRAHNRWLADFCSDAPGRRAGIAQILLHDVDAAVEEIKWAKANGLTGGVVLPGAPPGSGIAPLYAPDYEPIWSVCEDLAMPVNHHSGSAAPDYGNYPAANVMFLLEVVWWAHRTLWHLIFAGVMERHPDLQFVFTEQGTKWIPEEITRLDYYHARMSQAQGSQEAEFGSEAMSQLSLRPSEYWARQCQLGSSFIRHMEVPLRHAVGIERIMWGNDFPHLEGCWPWSPDHLRLAFNDVEPDEIQAMVGDNAARVYGFDIDALAPIAEPFAPRVEEVAKPIAVADIPEEAMRCPAFAAAALMG